MPLPPTLAPITRQPTLSADGLEPLWLPAPLPANFVKKVKEEYQEEYDQDVLFCTYQTHYYTNLSTQWQEMQYEPTGKFALNHEGEVIADPEELNNLNLSLLSNTLNRARHYASPETFFSVILKKKLKGYFGLHIYASRIDLQPFMSFDDPWSLRRKALPNTLLRLPNNCLKDPAFPSLNSIKPLPLSVQRTIASKVRTLPRAVEPLFWNVA